MYWVITCTLYIYIHGYVFAIIDMNYIHPTGNQYDPKGRSRLVVTFMVMFQDQQVVKLRAQVD